MTGRNGADPDVQRRESRRDAARAQPGERRFGGMEPGGRGGHGAGVLRENGLIALGIEGLVGPAHVRRQGHVPVRLESRFDAALRRHTHAQRALSVRPEYLAGERARGDARARPQRAIGPAEREPASRCRGSALDARGEEQLYLAPRLRTCAEHPRPEDPGVVRTRRDCPAAPGRPSRESSRHERPRARRRASAPLAHPRADAARWRPPAARSRASSFARRFPSTVGSCNGTKLSRLTPRWTSALPAFEGDAEPGHLPPERGRADVEGLGGAFAAAVALAEAPLRWPARSASSTTSASVRPVARRVLRAALAGRMSSGVTTPPEQSATACSIMFSSSRTLPGKS